MAVRGTITFSITSELRRLIREWLHSGHDGNASEVVRAALRLMIEREQPVSDPTTRTVSKSSAL